MSCSQWASGSGWRVALGCTSWVSEGRQDLLTLTMYEAAGWGTLQRLLVGRESQWAPCILIHLGQSQGPCYIYSQASCMHAEARVATQIWSCATHYTIHKTDHRDTGTSYILEQKKTQKKITPKRGITSVRKKGGYFNFLSEKLLSKIPVIRPQQNISFYTW